MAKREKELDGQTRFDWEARVDACVEAHSKIVDACYEDRPAVAMGIDDACQEIAVAIKQGLRRSGLSREQLVDQVNEYFGLNDEDQEGRRPLSIHMLNHYLSKATEYPLPAYLLIPIITIIGSFEPVRIIAEAAGGRVISEADVRLMNVGKLVTTIKEMKKLQRELTGV